MLPLEAVLLVVVPPVTRLDEEEPVVLMVFEVVSGAGGAALRVASADELTTEDKDLGSSDKHLTLSVEPLLSV